MYSKLNSFGVSGVGGYKVSVEISITRGLPAFDIVGLPDAAVKEARERVRAALKNSGYEFPVSRLTVNLAPADMRKAGTVYDLPIYIAILLATGTIKKISEKMGFLGELSLNGDVRPISGVLPMAIYALKNGITELFVPEDNAAEASFAGDISVFPVKNAAQLINHLKGIEIIEPVAKRDYTPSEDYYPDFSDVKGQETVKRAFEIAAAGSHNILLIGPPGAGKSMMARRLPGILPDMTQNEMIETTEIHSVAGLTSKESPIVSHRAFRSPHHTVSAAGLSGGGSIPRPGEISLAHNGVLFLDELPEFKSDVLEVLRQPLEDGQVTVSRVSGTVTFPSIFMLVCAMNPCRCGWYGHPSGRCRCSYNEVKKYQSKVSGPLLDRIDIIVEVPALEFNDLIDNSSSELSAEIKKRVNMARSRQLTRYENSASVSNAHLSPSDIKKYCFLTPECEELMRDAFDNLGLSARSYDRILKVARTIADLDDSETIKVSHLAEAIQYRSFVIGV